VTRTRGTLSTALAVLALWSTPLAGQRSDTHLLIVTGLSGEPGYAARFKQAGDLLFDAARTRWLVADSSLWYLAEDPTRDPTRIRARSTREEIAAAFVALTRRALPGDLVVIVLIGHGSGEGRDSRVDIPGPDATASDYAAWIAPLSKQRIVFVVAASASGDFLSVVSGPGRVVITATKAASERNESVFGEAFARGIGTTEADADKDGRISILEAFSYARQAVRTAYESKQRLLTEHAQLDDDGDGKGSADPAAAASGDGALARKITLGPPRGSTDPRVAVLTAERQALEAEVAALRGRKATTDSLRYEAELERLLVLIAEKSRAIRALEQRGPP
jgi:hypothetical protein